MSRCYKEHDLNEKTCRFSKKCKSGFERNENFICREKKSVKQQRSVKPKTEKKRSVKKRSVKKNSSMNMFYKMLGNSPYERVNGNSPYKKINSPMNRSNKSKKSKSISFN